MDDLGGSERIDHQNDFVRLWVRHDGVAIPVDVLFVYADGGSHILLIENGDLQIRAYRAFSRRLAWRSRGSSLLQMALVPWTFESAQDIFVPAKEFLRAHPHTVGDLPDTGGLRPNQFLLKNRRKPWSLSYLFHCMSSYWYSSFALVVAPVLSSSDDA